MWIFILTTWANNTQPGSSGLIPFKSSHTYPIFVLTDLFEGKTFQQDDNSLFALTHLYTGSGSYDIDTNWHSCSLLNKLELYRRSRQEAYVISEKELNMDIQVLLHFYLTDLASYLLFLGTAIVKKNKELIIRTLTLLLLLHLTFGAISQDFLIWSIFVGCILLLGIYELIPKRYEGEQNRSVKTLTG